MMQSNTFNDCPRLYYRNVTLRVPATFHLHLWPTDLRWYILSKKKAHNSTLNLFPFKENGKVPRNLINSIQSRNLPTEFMLKNIITIFVQKEYFK